MYDTNDFYYESLFIREKIKEKLIKKYITLANASVRFGKPRPQFYQAESFGNTKLLDDICKDLDCSIDSVIKKTYDEPYKEIRFTYHGLFTEIQAIKNRPNKLCVQMYYLKKNPKRRLDLMSLLCFMKMTGKSAQYLLS